MRTLPPGDFGRAKSPLPMPSAHSHCSSEDTAAYGFGCLGAGLHAAFRTVFSGSSRASSSPRRRSAAKDYDSGSFEVSGSESESPRGQVTGVLPPGPPPPPSSSAGHPQRKTTPNLASAVKARKANQAGAPPPNLAVFVSVYHDQDHATSEMLFAKVRIWAKKVIMIQLRVYRRAYISWLAIVVVIGSFAFWGACWEGGYDMPFLDAVFLTVSSITMTGLSTVDLSSVPVGAQVVLWLEIVAASPLLMSIVPVAIRLWVVRSHKNACHKYGVAFFGLNTTLDDDEMVLKVIIVTVALYWFFSQFIGWVIYVVCFRTYGGSVPWAWHALFLTTSAFCNAGLTTTPNNLPWKGSPIAWPVLLTVSFQIMGGNTWAPIALRFLFWLQYKVAVCRGSHIREKVLYMLLRYPRTCYSHLFPDYATRWLLIVQSGLILAQIVLWLIETESLGEVMADTTLSEYALVTFFQCVTTRTAGLSVADMSLLPGGILVMQLVAFWISTTPVTVLMKSTVRKQHIKGDQEIYADGDSRRSHDTASVKGQFQNLMTVSMPVLFFLLIVMLVIEDANHSNPSERLTRAVHVVYEFASGYGTVGLSMSGKAWSDVHYWTRYSQAALMIVMLLGRIRGLPDSIDPTLDVSQWYLDEKLGRVEEENYSPPRRQRSASDPFPMQNATGGQEDQHFTGARQDSTNTMMTASSQRRSIKQLFERESSRQSTAEEPVDHGGQ